LCLDTITAEGVAYMNWLTELVLLVFLVYLAYQLRKLPEKLDRYLRSFAVEYKRWFDQDTLYDEVIRQEREISFPEHVARLKQQRRTRRMEMNRENDANVFRRVDSATAEAIERRNQERLRELDEEINQEMRDGTSS
jgi:hypothetical protein